MVWVHDVSLPLPQEKRIFLVGCFCFSIPLPLAVMGFIYGLRMAVFIMGPLQTLVFHFMGDIRDKDASGDLYLFLSSCFSPPPVLHH